MTKKLPEQVEPPPQEDQARHSGSYQATPEELEAIDEALGQMARGEKASKEEIEGAFAKFRRA